MIDFRNYEVMSFDCYGTLIDWETGILHALDGFRRTHGVDATDEELLAAHARAEAHIQRGYFRPYKDVLREAMKQVAVQFRIAPADVDEDVIVNSLPSWKPFPDTVESLVTLGRYFSLGVISNIDDDLFAMTQRHLQSDFNWVVTAQQVGAYKPAHKMFREALKAAGVHPTRIVHVAQSRFHDIKPAHTLGWKTVWVDRYGHSTNKRASNATGNEGDVVVESLAELVEVIRGQIGEPGERAAEERFYI